MAGGNCVKENMIGRILSALTPSLSPGRGRLWIPRSEKCGAFRFVFALRKTSRYENLRVDCQNSGEAATFLPLLGGEGRGEGERFFSLTKLALIFGLLLCTNPQAIRAANPNELVSKWLLQQTNIHTWSADFVQTRALKSMTQPLVSTGQVWFAAPNRFHWELGNPAQTIAVRQPEQMLLIYPKLKRVEKYPLSGAASGPWRDALGLLEAGFPRSQAEVDSRFNTQSIEAKNGVCEITLQPKSSAARKMMSQIKIAFGTNDFLLRATELKFADGSTMRNDFSNPKLNEKLDEKLFSPELDSSYKVVEPMKK